DQRRARARHHRYADADKGVADHIARDGDVAEIFAPAGDDPERRRVLDHVAGDGRIRLDIDADAGIVVRRGADRPLRNQVADDVALDHGNAATLVEIANGDADGRAIDGVVGDDSTLEGEFR